MSAVEPKQPERSLGELIGDLGRDISNLVRQEIELGREEISAEVSKASKAGAAFGGAAGVAFFAAFALVLAAGWGLAAVMPTGLAFLIVAIVLGAIAAVLALRGRKQMQEVEPKPEQTIQTLREDAQWLKEQRS
jgi:F0F1-type ATP synthase assembly protein I